MSQNTTFYELEKRIYKLVCELGCEIIKQILESQDKILMESRDKTIYRHKGYKSTTIKTQMGEIQYKRVMYKQNGKAVFLLDNTLKVGKVWNLSYNLVEQMLKSVVNSISYRKATEEVKNLTNETISHQALNKLVWAVGKEIQEKEEQEIKLMQEGKLIPGDKEVNVLFEEADGIWFNLQKQDRKEALDKYKKECERKNIKFSLKHKCHSELKLHVCYEGWSKDDRHELINKSYIAGMMSSKRLERLRDARIYQKYNLDVLKVRAMNGDGARWINNIATKDTITQKDSFHIQQAIVRNIQNEEDRQKLMQMVNDKKYNEVQDYIESLKYKYDGEEKKVKKLVTLQKYLKNGLPRYQDVLKEQNRELPEPPENMEYRNMGTMESQIFSVLKNKLESGRKSFLKEGASYLAKVCTEYYQNNDISLQKIESKIKIDNSVEEYIKEIEENVKKNRKVHRADAKETERYTYGQATIIEDNPIIQKLLKMLEPTELMYR